MKDNSKKIWLFIGLFIIVAGVILINNKFDLRAASTDHLDTYYTEDDSINDYYYSDNNQVTGSSPENFLQSNESNGPGLAVVLFVQAFVTIHMSLFVLWPLAKIFGKDKYKEKFIRMFVGRIIILLLFDAIIPVVAMIVDFMFVFIGAFLIVPLCSSLTGTKDIYSQTGFKKSVLLSSTNDAERVVFDSDTEVSNLEIANLGFGDIEVLKRALIQHYQEILQLYGERNFSELIKLCSPGIYTTFKSNADLYDKLEETLVISDILVDEGKIIRAEKYGQQIFLDLKIKYSCIEYVLGSADNLVRGSKTYRKEYTKILSFSKRLANNIVTTCPNCNASIDESDVEFCSYCGTAINFTGSDWVLKKETILKEK